MTYTQQIAKHFREVHFGGNWTSVNLKDVLNDVDWHMATRKMQSFNTIASLVFHINYYTSAVLKVLKNEPLRAHDKYSFDLPPLQSATDWDNLKMKAFNEAEEFAKMIELLPDSKLNEFLADEKYGNYLRNLLGIIEHTHYHLGQIVILKKLVVGY